MHNWKFWVVIVLVMANLGAEAQAGLFSTTCARRSVGDAYADANAVAMARAATRGDADEIARLAAQYPKLVNYVENGTVPPLFWAICADSVEGFEALLKAGANPNLPASGHGPGDGRGHGRRENGLIIREGNTPMFLAAEAGNEKFLRLAIAYGGDLNGRTGESKPNRPLLTAAYYGLKENLQILLEAGADINVVDEGGMTAPHYAIGVGGRFDIAIWLLEQGYSHDLQKLGGGAEISQVHERLQPWKEKLISMLRARGVTFPASAAYKRGFADREVPPEDVEDIILGRKNLFLYPMKKKAAI